MKRKVQIRCHKDIEDLASVITQSDFRTIYVDKIQEYTRFNGEVELLYFTVLRGCYGTEANYISIVSDYHTLKDLAVSISSKDLASNFTVIDDELRVSAKVRKSQAVMNNEMKLPCFYEITKVNINEGFWYALYKMILTDCKFVNITPDGEYIYTPCNQIEFYDKSSYIGYTYEVDGKEMHIQILNFVTDWVISDSIVLAVPKDVKETLTFIHEEDYICQKSFNFLTHNIYKVHLQDLALFDIDLDTFLDTFSHNYFVRDHEIVNLLRYEIAGMETAFNYIHNIEKEVKLIPNQVRKTRSDRNISVKYKHKGIDISTLQKNLQGTPHEEVLEVLTANTPDNLTSKSFIVGFMNTVDLASTPHKFDYTSYNLTLSRLNTYLAVSSLKAHRSKILNMITELGFNNVQDAFTISGTETEASLRIELTGF